MYISEMLEKKGRGEEFTKRELDDFVRHLCKHSISAVQLGAFLMAVFSKGMTLDEIANLTTCMICHSNRLRWSDQLWAGLTVDKHSTGGPGDKSNLILPPILVACGVKVPMITSRGLGITPGTIDKLESLKGFNPIQSEENLRELLNTAGFFIVGKTDNIVPADRQLDRFRDVTGTAACVPLIASSILANKLCEGIRGLVMDIKLGQGSIFTKPEEVRELSLTLIKVGRRLDLNVITIISWMEEPLGDCMGTALEMAEVFQCLAGGGLKGRLGELMTYIGMKMLAVAGITMRVTRAKTLFQEAITSGAAQASMRSMLIGQGVSRDMAEQLCGPVPESEMDPIMYFIKAMGMESVGQTNIFAPMAGYVIEIDPNTLAKINWSLGGCRNSLAEPINYTVGVRLYKHIGDSISKGELWCTIYHAEPTLSTELLIKAQSAITISSSPTTQKEIVQKIFE